MDKKEDRDKPGAGEVSLERRNFIVRSGMAAAVAAVAPTLMLTSQDAEAGLLAPTEVIKAVFDALTKDTFAGVAAFMVPGNDSYSLDQGEFYLFQQGALESDTDDFMIEIFNSIMEVPDTVAADLMVAITDALDEVSGPLPVGVAALLSPLEQWVMRRLEEHINKLVDQNENIPLAHVFALLLNVMASQVNPWAPGLKISPFSRLSWTEKAEVFKKFETELPDLLSSIASRLTGEMNEQIATLIRFAAGTTLQLSAFASYSEWHTYDSENRVLLGRPHGWNMSNYLPNGPVEGWDDFIGYYQGRTSVDA